MNRNVRWIGCGLMAMVATSAWGQVTMAPQNVRAAKIREVPREVSSRLMALQQNLQPSARSWVEEQARMEARRPAPDVESVRQAARRRFASSLAAPGFAGADIDALVAMVMMEAQKSSEQELRDMLAQMQSLNNNKKAVRDAISKIHGEVASSSATDATRPCRTPGCQSLSREMRQLAATTAQTKVPVRWTAPEVLTYAQLRQAEDQLKNQLDSMSEMGEQEQLRLQMAMDRRSKAVETLSNLMKKVSDTSEGVVKNLK